MIYPVSRNSAPAPDGKQSTAAPWDNTTVLCWEVQDKIYKCTDPLSFLSGRRDRASGVRGARCEGVVDGETILRLWGDR